MSGFVPLFPLYAFKVWAGINLPFLIIINVIITASAAATAATSPPPPPLVLCIVVSNPEKQVFHMVPRICLHCRNS